MNKIFSILVIVVLISSCSARKKVNVPIKENSIKINFYGYFQAITNKQFNKSTDYIFQELFEIYPKEQFIKAMEQTFNTPDKMEFDFKAPKILEIEKAKKVGDRFYSILKYSNLIHVKLKGEEEETKEDKQIRNNLTKQSLKEAFGAENVTYNLKTDVFQIYAEREAIAISDDGELNWKFLIIKDLHYSILKKLVPDEILSIKTLE